MTEQPDHVVARFSRILRHAIVDIYRARAAEARKTEAFEKELIAVDVGEALPGMLETRRSELIESGRSRCFDPSRATQHGPATSGHLERSTVDAKADIVTAGDLRGS